MALSIDAARERVQKRCDRVPPGAGWDGLRAMFDGIDIDVDGAIAAVQGLGQGIFDNNCEPAAVATSMVLAMLTGYEIGRSTS